MGRARDRDRPAQPHRGARGRHGAAARAFAQHFGRDTNVTVLVDFDNASLRTAVAVADALGDELWGVRLDTSERLVDETLADLGADAEPGVSVELARRVRAGLDEAGHGHVRIVASGGFDAERITAFEAAAAPVDAYGVGSSSCAARTTSRPTSCGWTASHARRSAARSAPTRGWSESSKKDDLSDRSRSAPIPWHALDLDSLYGGGPTASPHRQVSASSGSSAVARRRPTARCPRDGPAGHRDLPSGADDRP